MTMSEQELDALIDQRIAQRQATAYSDGNRLPDPVPPAAGTWAHDVMLTQERKRQERIAAAEAEERRQARAREEAAERRRQERARVADEARLELRKLGPKIAAASMILDEHEADVNEARTVLEHAQALERAASR